MTLNYKNRAVRCDIRVEMNNSGFETRAVRHVIRLEPNVYNIVSSHTGQDISSNGSFYPYQIPNGIGSRAVRHVIRVEYRKEDVVPRAVRHVIRVEKNNSGETRAVRHVIRVEPNVYNIVPSHTGRDITPNQFFYPYFIPYGIWAKTISENFKELAI